MILSRLVHWHAGLGDAFQSPGELVRCMKPGLLLNASAVPQVRQITRQGVPVALNRYVLDYWQHGQKQALVNYNHFREGDAKTLTNIGLMQQMLAANDV